MHFGRRALAARHDSLLEIQMFESSRKKPPRVSGSRPGDSVNKVRRMGAAHAPPAYAEARPADTSWRQSWHEGPPEPFVQDAPALEVGLETKQFVLLKHALPPPT